MQTIGRRSTYTQDGEDTFSNRLLRSCVFFSSIWRHLVVLPPFSTSSRHMCPGWEPLVASLGWAVSPSWADTWVACSSFRWMQMERRCKVGRPGNVGNPKSGDLLPLLSCPWLPALCFTRNIFVEWNLVNSFLHELIKLDDTRALLRELCNVVFVKGIR